jgi:hypothetical protein
MPVLAKRFLQRSRIPVFQSRSATDRGTRPQCPTNRVEHALIFATIILVPLQNQGIDGIGIPGVSYVYLLFVAQAAYIIGKRADCLAKTWQHSLLLSVYIFIGVGYLLEGIHPFSDYGEIYRMVQSFAGSILLASLCRDRRALRIAMYGYLFTAIYTSKAILGTYGTLSSATALDYGEGDRLRNAAFDDLSIDYNLNTLACIAAQGAGIAFAFGLTARSRWYSYLFLGLGLAFSVATFLTMSRSGVVTLAAVGAAVVLAYGVNRSRTIVIGLVVGLTTAAFVPHAVLSRMSFSTEVDEHGRMEGRAAVYTAFFHHLPDFIPTGIGRGNFWTAWGKNSEYGNSKGIVSGAHNVFFQMMIYWGLPALFGLFAIVWQGYRCLPGRYGDDGLAIALVAVAISLLLMALTVHNFYAKEFAIGIGLLVGAHRWIWSRPAARPLPMQRNRFRPSLKRV